MKSVRSVMLAASIASFAGPTKLAKATVENGAASLVIGQPDFVTAKLPDAPTGLVIGEPVSLALDNPASSVAQLLVVDRAYHRVLAYPLPKVSTSAVRLVDGQATLGLGLANQGAGVSETSLSAPSAVAGYAGEIAIADRDNNRTVVGYAIPLSTSWFLGQPDGRSNAPRAFGATLRSLSSPSGVAIDERGNVYVADRDDHRVVMFQDFGVAVSLFGQPDAASFAPNAGGAAPSTRSLRGPEAIAAVPLAGALPSKQQLWVVDRGNNRVLLIEPQILSDALAVLGQPDFTHGDPHPPTASTFDDPTGVAVDPARGGVWVVDRNHHRVLHFPSGSTVADRVLGQRDFTHGDAPTSVSATTLLYPTAVTVTVGGIVFVADTGHARVLGFNPSCTDPKACDDGDPCTNDACDTTYGCSHTFTTTSTECWPYLCNTATHHCQTSCSGSFQCQSGECIRNACVKPCDGRCACFAGFCCDRSCTGPCESCDSPGSVGKCTPVPAGSRASNKCPGGDEDCFDGCDGTHGDRCAPAAVGARCGAGSCQDGVAASAGSCDGAGNCRQSTIACGPYACGPATCRVRCDADWDCATGAICQSNVCVEIDAQAPVGGGCATGAGEPRSSWWLGLVVLGLLGRGRRA